ncbi:MULTISPECIES: thioesterase family protein [unclassified Dysgonomonas]|uniref:acyl-CoA thioesterase n=1 Tax=unclassified Dysgonomonas TaxID=2630389 RepID=UPI0024768750|nr:MULTISPECIES: thioesterase family protein [unclassified Dysgonomonas]
MEITQEVFKKTIPIQIRFGDIDAIGHINNNIYYSYFDLGKSHYFEDMKAGVVNWTDGIIVLARSETDFFSPVFYKENIAVDTKIMHLGNKSGVFLQQIRNTDTDEVRCRCKSTFVYYNPDEGKSMPIPQIWRDVISCFEEVTF